jgi:hypothetical protein
MTPLILGVAIGLVLKVLVPMPWLDDPVRKGWAWVWSKVS